MLYRCRCSTTLDDGFRGRLLAGEGQIHIDDLRDFAVSNDEARTAALIVLGFPSLPSWGCDCGYDAVAAANRRPQTLSFLSALLPTDCRQALFTDLLLDMRGPRGQSYGGSRHLREDGRENLPIVYRNAVAGGEPRPS
jgi:hypothetical protein